MRVQLNTHIEIANLFLGRPIFKPSLKATVRNDPCLFDYFRVSKNPRYMFLLGLQKHEQKEKQSELFGNLFTNLDYVLKYIVK